MKRLTLLVASALALASCQDATRPLDVDQDPAMGMVGQPLERMVVVFEPGTDRVPELATQLASQWGRAPSFVYETALQGFAAELPESAAEALARHPAVAYVEPDRERSIFAQATPTGIQRIFAESNANLDIDGTDDVRVDVDVAIIDTGIDFEHPDLDSEAAALPEATTTTTTEPMSRARSRPSTTAPAWSAWRPARGSGP